MDAFFPALAFFGMGDTEVLLVMVAILIFFGGDKLPEFARGLGKALRELKRATGDVEREFKRVIDEAEHPPAPAPFDKPPVSDTVSRPELPAPPPPSPSPPVPDKDYHSDI